jgi:hypothetical protein
VKEEANRVDTIVVIQLTTQWKHGFEKRLLKEEQKE